MRYFAPLAIPLDKQYVPVVRNNRTVSYKTAYFGKVSLGSPQQDFTVLFDTGSGHFFLPSATCDTETCRRHRRYDARASSTALEIDHEGREVGENATGRDQVAVAYGTGEIVGEFVWETVCLGGQQGPDCIQMRVVLATEMTTEPFGTFEFDGVLGLGLEGLAVDPEFSFFGQLFKLHNLTDARFGYFLSRTDELPSEITLGGHDERRMASALQWAPVHRPELGHWQLRIRSVTAGNETLSVCETGDCVAIADTGITTALAKFLARLTAFLFLSAPAAELQSAGSVDGAMDVRMAVQMRLNLLQQRYNLAWAMREPVQELVTSISILRRMLISEKSLHQQSAWTETPIARMMLRVEAANKEVASRKDHLQAKINVRDNLQDQLDALKRTKMEIHQLMEAEKQQKELESSTDMDEDKPSQGVVVFPEHPLEETPPGAASSPASTPAASTAGTAPSSASIQQAVQQQAEAQLKPMADQMMQMQQMMEDTTAGWITVKERAAAFESGSEGGQFSLGPRQRSSQRRPANDKGKSRTATAAFRKPQRRSDIEAVAKSAEDHRAPSSDAAQMDPYAESEYCHAGPQVLDRDSRIPIEVAIVGGDRTDSISCKLGQIGLLTRLQQEGCQIDLELDVSRVGLHAHAQLGLDMCPTSEHVAGQISIFVDGSFDEQDPSTAAWAMAVVAKDRAGLHVNFMALHAPYQDAQSRGIDTGALQRWWEETTAIAQRMSVDVVSVDDNARVGSMSSTAVGVGGWAEEENVSGTCFHQFMCELGLFAPSTFSDPSWSRDTEPSGFTFVQNGAYHRIDYVLVKPHFVPAIVFEHVWSDLDNLMEEVYPRKPYADQLTLYFVKWRRKNKALSLLISFEACLWELRLAALAFLELLDFDSWDGALGGVLSATAGLLKKKLDIDKTDTLERMVSEMSEAGMRTQEPLAFKGGWAHDLYKNSGSAAMHESYRQRLLMNNVAKHHHKFLRDQFKTLVAGLMIETQMGGAQGKGADMATHMVRTFSAVSCAQGLSTVLAFIDLNSAFYKVTRPIVVPFRQDPQDIADAIDAADILEALVPILEHTIAQPSVLAGLDNVHRTLRLIVSRTAPLLMTSASWP
ncbi:unnamed protein product [Prorocentrum cordatum]|uniref:Peptidase A1 domain-containing protein n=1 Tax=Prorocentrum cordatum TaxID=2364126 RepID=A0ABN9VMQ6_9DINO|nr:unnamed protein product [Polarella glacialis]